MSDRIPRTAAGRAATGIVLTRDILVIEDEAALAAVDACIYIVQQSLDTVRAEDDGESRSIRASIAAREHVIALLTGYREGLAPRIALALASEPRAERLRAAAKRVLAFADEAVSDDDGSAYWDHLDPLFTDLLGILRAALV